MDKKKAKKKTAKKKQCRIKAVEDRKNKQEITESNPKGSGNATTVIDWSIVAKLCGMKATGEEVAAFLDIDYDTLNLNCKKDNDIGFVEFRAAKTLVGNVSLRRRQWMLAMEGNVPMCIFLGKQQLGQKEKNDHSSDDGTMSPDGLSTSQRKALDELNESEY